MHGQYYPCVVYGVMESGYSHILEKEWLADNFPDLMTYTSDVVRLYMCRAVYGYEVPLDADSGHSEEATEEQKKSIQKLYTLLTDYWKEQETEEEEEEEKADYVMPEMGYFLAISGDYSVDEHEPYIPVEYEENSDKEDEDDDEGDE